MAIEQQLSFDFFEGENRRKKLKIAKEYQIVPTEENLEKLKQEDGVWYFGELKLEEWEEVHEGPDQYWK